MAKVNLTKPEVWQDRYQIAANGQERQFRKFASWFDTHYAHINTSQYALWRSKVFIPLIPSKARAMVTKLTSLKPGWEIGLYGDALNDEQSQDKADKAQWKLEHDWDNPFFDEPMSDKLFAPLVDAVVTGTGIAKVPWCYEDKIRYEKHIDDVTGEIDLTKDDKIVSGNGYNDLIPHDIMATFISPGAKNLQSAQWVILEDWVTYDQLSQENEATGGIMYDKDALSKVKDMKSESDRFTNEKNSRNQIRSMEDPIKADGTVDQFKRLECYERSSGYIYIFAVGDNGEGEESFVQLKAKKNPYWHGKYPLVAFYVEKRPFSFWGKGVYEDTERLQAAFNDLFNFLLDGINLSQAPMILKQEGEEYSYIVEPGGEFLYQSEKPEPFTFPEPNPAQFQNALNFIESQVENSTISSYATGNPSSATDTTSGTATGIMRLQEAAGDKLSGMKAQYANALREVGRMWLSNNQQFLDQPIQLMGQVDSQPAPVEISPQDLQGQMILRVNDASMEPSTKEQVVQQFEAYLAQLNQLQQASIQQAQMTKWSTSPVYLDYGSLVQDLSQKMGQANFDKILLPQNEVEQAMSNSKSPMIMPNERFMIDINEMYGSEAAQWLQRNGIEPDPARQAQIPLATMDNQVEMTKAQSQAPTEQGPNPQDETKAQLEAAKIALQAQQQGHQQEMDHADMLLKVHQAANGGNDGQEKAPTGSGR